MSSSPPRSPFQQVLFRIPLQSIGLLSLLADSDYIENQLPSYFNTPLLQKALYLASPSLYKEVFPSAIQTDKKVSKALLLALYKYAIRSASRPTPFGYFAGLCLGTIDNKATGLRGQPIPYTRLDSGALVQIYSLLLDLPSFRRSLTYTVTNTYYQFGEEYRYSEFIENGLSREVMLSSVHAAVPLPALINYLDKPRIYADLVWFLRHNYDFDSESIYTYLDRLIDCRFLISSLEPSVSGSPYIDRLCAQVESIPLENSVWSSIRDLASPPSNDEVSQLQKIDEWFLNQGLVTENQQSFWQSNLWFSGSSLSVPQSVYKQLNRQLLAIQPLLTTGRPTWLSSFQERFVNRFGNQPVPLLSVFDIDAGLEFVPDSHIEHSSPLAQQIQNNLPIRDKILSAEKDSAYQLRNKLFHRAQLHKHRYVTLTDQDLPPAIHQQVPLAWSAFGSLVATNLNELDRGHYQFQLNQVLENPTALLGRFCQDSAELTGLVEQFHQYEASQYPEYLFAEIVHLAGARSGNVNVRPTLRLYEIPYITLPSVDAEHTLELADLMVVSPDGGELQLWSRKHKKRVIPRLSTAHNTSHGDIIYQFLSALQYQFDFGGRWSWRELAQEPFLPRICYNQIILARAQWTLRDTDVDQWATFKDTYGLDRYVLLQQGDNELLLDLDNPILERYVLAEVRKKGQLVLLESIQTPDRCWIRDDQHQPYAHELLLFFDGKLQSTSSTAPVFSWSNIEQASSIQRTFMPGSEWLYVKLYGSQASATPFLIDSVAPLVYELRQRGWIDNWFFIRYADPDYHLRIRLHLTNNDYFGPICQMLYDTWQHQPTGYLRSLQIDTYERELGRYGYQAIDTCEHYFGIDSDFMVRLYAGQMDLNETARILKAVSLIKEMLVSFGLSLEECLQLSRQRQTAYWTEFGKTSAIRKLLNQFYRELQATIYPVLNHQFVEHPDFGDQQEWYRWLNERAEQSKPLVDSINQLLIPADRIPVIMSLIHMSLNRLFPSQLRLYELICYHFICRYYESEVVRQ